VPFSTLQLDAKLCEILGFVAPRFC